MKKFLRSNLPIKKIVFILVVLLVAGATKSNPQSGRRVFGIGSGSISSAIGITPAPNIQSALSVQAPWTVIGSEQPFDEPDPWLAADFTTLEFEFGKSTLRGTGTVRSSNRVVVNGGRFLRGLVIEDCKDVTINDADLAGGLFLTNCNKVLVLESRFTPTGQSPGVGIFIDNCRSHEQRVLLKNQQGFRTVQISDCHFRGTGPFPGILADDSDVDIVACKFETLGARGIEVQNGSFLTVRQTEILDAAEIGIMLHESDGTISKTKVIGVERIGSISRGIQISATGDNVFAISGCEIWGVNEGIFVSGGWGFIGQPNTNELQLPNAIRNVADDGVQIGRYPALRNAPASVQDTAIVLLNGFRGSIGRTSANDVRRIALLGRNADRIEVYRGVWNGSNKGEGGPGIVGFNISGTTTGRAHDVQINNFRNFFNSSIPVSLNPKSQLADVRDDN